MLRKCWFALVVAFTSASAMALAVACGSETAAGPDGDAASDGSNSEAEASSGGIDIDCGQTPTLHENKPLRCPTAAGVSINCAAGARCCQPAVDAGGDSECATSCPSAADGGPFAGVVWECEDPTHCAAFDAGGACCGVGSIDFDQACGYRRSRVFRGTTCKATCASNEFIVCENAAQCPAGLTCTPIKARGGQMGACLP